MNVLMISPGYPADMPEFTRGLSASGAKVIGIGDQSTAALPALVRESLSAYIQVRSLWNSQAVIAELHNQLGSHRLDAIECLWEPGIMLAAELREHFGVDGLTVGQAHCFRDKEAMKQALDKAGIRTPRHVAVNSVSDCWDAAEKIGFPVILKPIDGAGSADTYRVSNRQELRGVLPLLRHVPTISVEEFIEGEEFTFDAITVAGKVVYYNVAMYRPRPLIARSHEWISPQVIALRDVEDAGLAKGIQMGHEVITALGFGSGFTHMEWYRKANGEVIFGEIGARPPGAHQVDQMKYACEFDVFKAWGQAIVQQHLSLPFSRNYNVANIYKRAKGMGKITAIEGLDTLQKQFGEHVVWSTLSAPGTPRRDWLKTLVSDGFVMLRHPDLQLTMEMADAVGSELHLYAE